MSDLNIFVIRIDYKPLNTDKMQKTLILSIIIFFLFSSELLFSQADAGPDQEICTDSTYLQATNPFPNTGEWTRLGGAGTVENPTLYNSFVSGLASGGNTFRWTVTIEGDEFYDDVLILHNIVYASAGLDDEVCTDYTEFPSEENQTWTYLSGCGSITENTTTNVWEVNLCQGDNELGLTVTNGICEDSDTLVITNNLVDEAIILSPQNDTVICENFIELEALEPLIGTGEWQIWAGGGAFDNPTNHITVVNGLLHGSNVIKWTVTNDYCSIYDELIVTNNSVVAIVGDTILTCHTDTVYFPIVDYTMWSYLSGCGSITENTTTNMWEIEVCEGENVLLQTVTNGICEDSDTLVISENGFETFAGEDQIVCDSVVVLQAQHHPGTNGIWTFTGPYVTILNPTSYITTVTGLQENTEHIFRWTVYQNGCSSWDEVIVYYDYLFASAGEDAQLCENYYQMNAEHPKGTTGIWTVTGTGGGTIENNTAWNTNITNLEPGTNHFEWYVTGYSCSSRDTVALTYNLPPIAQFEADSEEFTAPQEVIFTNTSDYWPGWTEPDEFIWSIDDIYLETTYNINESVSYTFTNTGETDSIYFITLIAEDYQTSCTDTFTSSVTAHPQEESIYDLNANFKVFPNPTDGLINISSATDISDAVFELKNIAGQEVQYKLIEKTSHSCGIDISNLAYGVYFLKINLKGELKMLRLVKK